MSEEVELKLELRPEDADALKAAGFLPGKPKIVAQRSIYFDTPDRDLFERGFSLRIRLARKKRTQTIKADGASAAGLFARAEWEFEVKNDVPVIDDAGPIKSHLGKSADDIGLAFIIEVERQKWDIFEGDSQIEMVLDRGHAIAGDQKVPICEVELELKHGRQGALFALARTIDAIVPVRLGVLTKSERGYRLDSPERKVFKAEKVVLGTDIGAAQAFQQVVQRCIRHYRLNEAVLLGEHNVEALHQSRVALRRLRSAFSIFGRLLGKEGGSDLREKLRTLTGELGNARNLDVLLERAAAGPLRDRLQVAREAAYARVDDVILSAETRALMLDLVEWTIEGDWLRDPETEQDRSASVRDYAVAALSRLRRRVKKDGRDLSEISEDARHEVRKDAKKLRYAAEFFGSLFVTKKQGRRYKRFSSALQDLQDSLGLLNDLATAPLVLEELGIADDPEAAGLLASGNRTKLLRRSEKAYDRLVKAKRFWR